MEDLTRLVEDQQGPLFAFLYRMCGDPSVAEELMQETFVRALRAAATYRAKAKVSTWLFSIAANLVRDRWRRQSRQTPTLPLEDARTVVVRTAEEAALERISYAQVRQALLQLPIEQRAALVLRYYHDLSYDEIAGALACPIGTVRSRIHNGLKRLKTLMAEEVAAR